MEQTTQTNSTAIENISICNKPKKGRKPCLTDKEKAERARLSSKKYYYQNLEQERGTD